MSLALKDYANTSEQPKEWFHLEKVDHRKDSYTELLAKWVLILDSIVYSRPL